MCRGFVYKNRSSGDPTKKCYGCESKSTLSILAGSEGFLQVLSAMSKCVRHCIFMFFSKWGKGYFNCLTGMAYPNLK